MSTLALNIHFASVVLHLVTKGERLDDEKGRTRIETLKALCQMCPSQALHVRALCVSIKKIIITTCASSVCEYKKH